jgi:putative flippase GtrA
MSAPRETAGEVVRYLVVGVLTTVVSLSVYYGLVFTVLDAKNPLQLQAANIISWVAAVTFAYVMNRMVVFRSHSRDILREAGAFYGARLGTLFTEMVFMFLLVSVLKMNDRIVKLLMQVVVTVLNYVFSKLWVFRKGS